MRALAAIAVLVCALPAAAKSPEQKAFLRLAVNGVEKGDVLAVLRDGDVLVKAVDLAAAGLRDIDGRREAREGTEWVPLSSIAGEVRWQVDSKAAALRLTADVEHLAPNALDLAQSPRPAEMVFAPASSLFLNYALQTVNGARPTGFSEAGLSLGTVLLYSAASVGPDGKVVRGLSNLTWDDPGGLRRTVAGDFFAGGSALGSAVTLLGLSFARETSLDPYFVAAPHQDLRGATGTPSSVEIYAGDRLVRTEQLAPGPFEIRNVPGYAATTRVVVRDAFGRAQEFAVGTRSTAALLAPGLSDFAYQVGVQRKELGSQSFSYGQPALLARHRIGVTPFLTLGARGEASPDAAAFGPTITLGSVLGNFDLAAAGSRSGAYSGAAAWASYGVSFSRLALGGEATWMSRRYANVVLTPDADRPRLSLRLLASTSVGPLNLAGGYVASFMRDGSLQRRLSASTTLRAGDHFSLFAEGSMEAGRPQTLTAFVGLTFMLGRSTTTASVQGTPSNPLPALVSQMPLPIGSGVGYTLRTLGGPNPQASADVQAQGAYGLLQASYTRWDDSQRWSAGAAGALIAVDGALFATRPVQQGYALVQVPGVRGVRVYLNNQEMGRTDSSGRLLLPDVMPYYGNRFRIADSDLPLDYSLRTAERTVAGPVRGSALARFEAHRVLAYTGRAMVAGAPAPAGTVMWFDGRRYPLGLDGRFYLEGVAPGRRVAELELEGVPCKMTLDLPVTLLPVRDIGVLGCAGGVLAGRLFVDENGDGLYQPGEPLLEGVRLKIGGKPVTTDATGRYSVTDARTQDVLPADPLELPAGFSVGAAPGGDLAVHKPKPLRDLGAALILDLPAGPVRMMQLQAATIPIRTWIAGAGLSDEQDAAIQRLGTDVLDAQDLRVLVVVHPAQVPGNAWADALKAARATLRYLKGPALVPSSRLIWTMAEPGSGEAQGSVDVLLVRVPR